MIDITALDERIRTIAAEMAKRPDYVHQRSVEAILGLPSREYLRLSREKAWPSTKERRLIFALTADVASYLAMRIRLRREAPANTTDAEVIAFSKVGARRI